MAALQCKTKISWEVLLYDQIVHFDLIEKSAFVRDLCHSGWFRSTVGVPLFMLVRKLLCTPIAPDNRNITGFDVADATYADASIVASLQNTLCEIFDICQIADTEWLCTILSKFEGITRVDAQGSTVRSVEIAYSHTLPSRDGTVPIVD